MIVSSHELGTSWPFFLQLWLFLESLFAFVCMGALGASPGRSRLMRTCMPVRVGVGVPATSKQLRVVIIIKLQYHAFCDVCVSLVFCWRRLAIYLLQIITLEIAIFCSDTLMRIS